MHDEFRLPRADQCVTVLGARGTGKTIFGAWLLSHARFDKRPYIIMDYKREVLWEHPGLDMVLQRLRLGSLPSKNARGLYIVDVVPGQEDDVEAWLWDIWKRGNTGIFADEATLLPHRNAFQALLRQGRSKTIPMIMCSQRPVDIEREVFTEASYISLMRLQDERDYKTVEHFTGLKNLRSSPLPKYWSRWYSAETGATATLKPCPAPDAIVDRLRENVPYRVKLFFT